MEKNTLLRCLATGKNLIEANTAFFVKKVDKKRMDAGKKMEHHLAGLLRGPDGNAVVEFLVPSRSEAGVMRHCFIDVIPKGTNLFNIAQTTKKLADRVKLLKEADVKCYCSCPDFNWSGMKYNLKHKHDSLAAGHHSDDPRDDNGEDIFPKVRDPQQQTTICSHLVAALKGMVSNAGAIMKAARTAPPEEKPAEPEVNPKDQLVGNKTAEDEANNKIDLLDKDNVKLTEEQEEDREKATQAAMEAFESPDSEPIKLDATQSAMDALAENIEPGSEPTEYAEENPGVGLIGNQENEERAEHKMNAFPDLDEEANNPMFDMPVDEEPEVSVDDEDIIEGPLKLP